MIKLFNINDYTIDTSDFSNILHDKCVTELEESFAKYVGAKYACSINSATNAIFLLFLNKNIEVSVPSMIPPVVLNALITSGNSINFVDDPCWVGDSYVLHDFGDYKVIDSAQKVEFNQFGLNAKENDLMFFSFYPTKPVGGIDGGMIVSNDFNKISWLKEAVMNGMSFSENNWDRKIKFPGYKMYLNSVQAYIANKNFKKLAEKKAKLKIVRDYYNNAFNLDNSSEHLYRIKVRDNKKFLTFSKENGFTSGIHYFCQHNNDIFSKKQFYCPVSEKESSQTVSLPFHENLDVRDLDFIISKIKIFNEKV